MPPVLSAPASPACRLQALRSRALGTLALAALALGGAALAPLAIGPALAQPAPRTLRFVIIPKVTHPWFDEVLRGAEQAARMIQAQSGSTRVVVDYQPPAQALVDQQAAILERAIAARPDGITIDPLDAARITPLLQQARSQGIPLTVFDAESPEGLAIPSIGTDFCRQAQIASRRLVALLGGTGQVAIMQGVPTASNHAIRARCHQEVFRRFPGIQVVAQPSDQDDIARAEREAIAVMKAHPKLRGWVASDASGPVGIGRAIAALGAQGRVRAVGLDDLPELQQQIRAGVVDSSAASRPRAQGYWSVLQLWQQGLGAPAIERIDTGISVIGPGSGPGSGSGSGSGSGNP